MNKTNMNKAKAVAVAIVVAGAALAFGSMVGAQGTPLAINCSGTVSTNVITWTATPTGGTAPYALLWTGTNVAGATSTSVTATYNATGTVNVGVQVTDSSASTTASSTVATTTCSATIVSLPTPPPAPLAVSCSGSAVNNVVTWTANPTGGRTPYSFLWSGTNVSGTTNPVQATYSATGTVTANVQVTDASSTAATSACSTTVSSLGGTPAPTSTPPAPRVNQPILHIEGNGRFLGRGMIVTSVASGSIQASVWGITYTINLANTGLEFLRRDGNTIMLLPAQQILVGDEVSASGFIDPSAPLVVNAGVVRDFSIISIRPKHGDDNEDNGGEHGGEHGNGFGVIMNGNVNANANGSTNVTTDAQGRLNDLLKQLQSLQSLFNSRSGKGNGGDHGGGRD